MRVWGSRGRDAIWVGQGAISLWKKLKWRSWAGMVGRAHPQSRNPHILNEVWRCLYPQYFGMITFYSVFHFYPFLVLARGMEYPDISPTHLHKYFSPTTQFVPGYFPHIHVWIIVLFSCMYVYRQECTYVHRHVMYICTLCISNVSTYATVCMYVCY